jgi:hypothetical protein
LAARGRRLAAVGLVATAPLAFAADAGAITFGQEGDPYTTGTNPYGVVATDFNDDSRPDVATVNGTASTLSVYLRATDTAFSEEATSPYAVGGGPNYAAVADFNGDGRPDIATSNYDANTGHTVTVLLRQGSGGFAQDAGSPVPVADGPGAIAAGDFNGDTRPDLAVARLDGAAVSILYRDASDGFSVGENYAVGTNPRHLAVDDFNSDGRPDLAVANLGRDDVTVLLRTAGGSFATEPAVSVGDQPANVLAEDFNDDGAPDLAVTNFGSNTVSILLRKETNDGFSQEVGSPIGVGTGPIGLATGDFDSDGAPDLAVANNSDDTLTVLRRTTGGFAPDPEDPISVGNGPYGLAVQDFDADARPDIALGHDGASELWVLLNTTTPPPDPVIDTDGDGVPDSEDLCPTVPANTADGCPRETPPPPAPTLGETANVEPVEGEVLVALPTTVGANARAAQKGLDFVPLTGPRQIPVGSFLDTREGKVSLTLARDAEGATQSGAFAAGLFQILQSRKEAKRGLTTLQLKGSRASFKRCRAEEGSARASLTRRQIRRLRARARGRYRTRSRYSAATVRGTTWTVIDRCDGTLTKVRRGKVAVRDFRRKKTIVLTRGKRYLARAPE